MEDDLSITEDQCFHCFSDTLNLILDYSFMLPIKQTGMQQSFKFFSHKLEKVSDFSNNKK